MPLKESLAAVLRLTRVAQGLSQEEVPAGVKNRHLSNMELAKSSPTLAALEDLAAGLGVDLVALLAVSSAHDKGLDLNQYLGNVAAEVGRLQSMGVLDKIDGEFEGGKLVRVHPRIRSAALTQAAVLKCKDAGMTQKEACEALGLGKATVSRIWNGVNVSR